MPSIPSDDILCIDYSVKMPMLQLPCRTVLVRLGHGVVMISPAVDLANAMAQVESFGKVTDLVAPNLYHHLGIRNARALFPEATLWGVAGLTEKRPRVPWDKVFAPEHWPYSSELELIPIAGAPGVNEVALLHRESRTLIATDLCFNHVHGHGLGHWLVFHAFGAYRKLATSRMLAMMIKDKPAMRESLREVLGKEFDNILMAHGEPVVGNGKQLLTAALQERGLI